MHDETELASQIAATLLAGTQRATHSDADIQLAVRTAFKVITYVRAEQSQRTVPLEPSPASGRAAKDYNSFDER